MAHNDRRRVVRGEIFTGPVETQDDVAAVRLRLMRAVEQDTISGSRATALLKGLDAMSRHIERYGSRQGAEGGAGVLRLLPGTTLVQMETELDTILTMEQLDELETRLAEDERNGVETPSDFADVMLRYLGVKSRRRDVTAAQRAAIPAE